MTNAAGATPEDEGKPGTALAALPDSATGVEPFAADGADPAAARGLRTRLLDYSAHAAMVVGLLGFAWTVGDHMVHRTASPDVPAKAETARSIEATKSSEATNSSEASKSAARTDPLAELRARNATLAADVQRLQARLEALQASLGDQAKVSAQVKVLQAGLDSVRQTMGAARSDQSAAVARLDGKIDKLAQHDPNSRMQQLVDRLGRLEHGVVDPAPTASLPPGTKVANFAPQPAPRPAEIKAGEPKPAETKAAETKAGESKADAKLGADEPAKPAVIAAWVVRDVYEGVALLEGRRGTIEVVPGVSIPGAGVVKSIDRHGSGWTVTTTKGLVAYAAPPRESRRADRGWGGYPGPGYRYDF